MNNKYTKKILHHLELGLVDSIDKKIDGWHIDDIDQKLSDDASCWFQKSIEIFNEAYSLASKDSMPGNIYLEITLNDSNNPGENCFGDIDQFNSSMSKQTPPEIITYIDSLIGDLGDIAKEKKYTFFPDYLKTYFVERYDDEDSCYRRSLIVCR